MLIDVHTYHPNSEAERSIVNLNYIKPEVNTTQHFSLGIHPWSISIDNYHSQLDSLESALCLNRVTALGECGLDIKIRALPFVIQVDVFQKQVELAQKYSIGSIIIHCVKAFNEIIRVVNSCGYKGNLIFHDFSGNIEIVKSLLKQNSYFSFGKSLYTRAQVCHLLLSKIPLEKLFLETDDQEKFRISEVYSQASKILEVSQSLLENQIHKNFEATFLS